MFESQSTTESCCSKVIVGLVVVCLGWTCQAGTTPSPPGPSLLNESTSSSSLNVNQLKVIYSPWRGSTGYS